MKKENLKKAISIICFTFLMSISSAFALESQMECQDTYYPSEATIKNNCALKTLSSEGNYNGGTDRYTYIIRIRDKSMSGTVLADCGIHAGKQNNRCTYSSQYYYWSHTHVHTYTRYNN